MPKGRNWTPDEMFRLRSLWQDGMRLDAIAETLGRSRDSVVFRAKLLGLPRRSPPLWTAEEDETICDCWSSMDSGEIASLLPGRTQYAVQIRASKLGLDAGLRAGRGAVLWTVPEDRTLARLCGAGVLIHDIARQLRRSIPSVNHRRKVLGLRNRRRKKIGQAEKTLIERLYLDGAPSKRIAAMVGCHYSTVLHFARRRGLRNGRRPGRPDDSQWGFTGT